MHLSTTFWSDTQELFHNLLLIKVEPLPNPPQDGQWDKYTTMYQTNLNNPWETALFFKQIAKFILTKPARETIHTNTWYQFAVIHQGEITPIKWFDLHINPHCTLSHDIAFDTTLVFKNQILQPFGKFPMLYKTKKLPKYRKLKLQHKIFTYIHNQIIQQIKA